MVLYKIYCHLMAFIWKIYYKAIYGSKLQLGSGFQFRKGFSLLIDGLGDVVREL